MRTTSGWTIAVLAVCGCHTDSSESVVAHDPCAPLAVSMVSATTVEQAGVNAAFDLWRAHGVTAFDNGSAGSATGAPIAIQFAEAAAAFHGQYDPDSDRVLINRDLTDPTELSIVIAHELGHAFGLIHVPASTRLSLMNPDNLITLPTDADQHALEALWGNCPQ